MKGQVGGTGYRLTGKMAPFNPQPSAPRPKRARWLAAIFAVLFVMAVVLGAARLFFSPLYPELEYRMPGFPGDPGGWSTDERAAWAAVPLEFIREAHGRAFLEEQRLDDGSVAFTPKEVSHLADVQDLFSFLMAFWLIAVLGATALVAITLRNGHDHVVRAGLRGGAWATLGLLGAVVLFGVIAFALLFDWFHGAFFSAGTWTFPDDSTLIRLYPERFWRDAMVGIAVISAAVAGLVLWQVPKAAAGDGH